MIRDDYCSHPLTILTVLAKKTKLKKKNKSKITLKKSNKN